MKTSVSSKFLIIFKMYCTHQNIIILLLEIVATENLWCTQELL